MEIKYKEVKEWLENNLYDVEVATKFKETDSTVDYLHGLMLQNKGADEKMKNVIKDNNSNINFYESETERLNNIFSRMNMSFCMSSDLTKQVDMLATCASHLGVHKPDETSMSLMMMDKSREMRGVKEAIVKEGMMVEKYVTKQQDLIHTSAQLEKLLLLLDQQEIENNNKTHGNTLKSDFLDKKIKQYNKNITTAKTELLNRGLSESLYHHNIIKIAGKLTEEKVKLNTLKCKIDAFHSLPPDITLAKVEIEKAKQELESIQVELKMYIGSIDI